MTNQDKTVLVTGGSGFIATHCILKLAAAGYKIKSTVRNLERASELNKILDRAGSTYERLNKIETTLQLMEKDLEAANNFIDGVPKGAMVSPQVQELYMLVEYLGENVDKLKEQMEAEIPMILKNDMVIQFHEERLIDLEERKNANH